MSAPLFRLPAAAVTRRAALYARTSTRDRQDPEVQLDRLRDYAARRGLQVVVDAQDAGESGARAKRPGLDVVLAAARRRDVDVVVVVRLDRLARSLRQLLDLSAEFQALGIGLVVLDQSIDTTTPAGRLMFSMVGAVAEFERDLIRERIRDGIAHAKAHGTRSGRPPGRRSRLTARLCAEVRDRRERGESWTTIGRAVSLPRSTVRLAFQAGQKTCAPALDVEGMVE